MEKQIELAFNDIEELYGSGCIERIREMMTDNISLRCPRQRGAKWIVPGLSKEPWLSKSSFTSYFEESITMLEEHSQKIISEFKKVNNQQIARPYEHYLGKKTNWNAIYLFRNETWTPESNAIFKETKNILLECLNDQLCPLLEVHFSILSPNSRIPLHSDLWNFTLNLHLGIDIPQKCYISVDGETREWEVGKALLFDYSFEHEAWNDSDFPRSSLLMDIWHPDLSIPEKYALTYFVKYLRAQGAGHLS